MGIKVMKLPNMQMKFVINGREWGTKFCFRLSVVHFMAALGHDAFACLTI